MVSPSSNKLSSVIYIPHGGGPLPILGDKAHEKMVTFLKEIAQDLDQPSAILVISAHWEEEQATTTGGNCPGLIYDGTQRVNITESIRHLTQAISNAREDRLQEAAKHIDEALNSLKKSAS